MQRGKIGSIARRAACCLAALTSSSSSTASSSLCFSCLSSSSTVLSRPATQGNIRQRTCRIPAMQPSSLAGRSSDEACFAGTLTGGAASSSSDAGPGKLFPLLVTIGPPCSGKTTLLRRLALNGVNIRDIAIDDHPEVYLKVALARFTGGEPSLPKSEPRIYGRNLAERLSDDDGARESALVAGRLQGVLSQEDFVAELRGLLGPGGTGGFGGGGQDGGVDVFSVAAALAEAVETACSEGRTMTTPTVDVFIREAIFPTAVTASLSLLTGHLMAHAGPVAWGNTNTKASDFRDALAAAAGAGRPVRFLCWGRDLPRLPLATLLSRGVQRFAETGRYIPAVAIALALKRTDVLLGATGGGDKRLLAAVAGFDLDPRDVPVPPPRDIYRARGGSGSGGRGGGGGDGGGGHSGGGGGHSGGGAGGRVGEGGGYRGSDGGGYRGGSRTGDDRAGSEWQENSAAPKARNAGNGSIGRTTEATSTGGHTASCTAENDVPRSPASKAIAVAIASTVEAGAVAVLGKLGGSACTRWRPALSFPDNRRHEYSPAGPARGGSTAAAMTAFSGTPSIGSRSGGSSSRSFFGRQIAVAGGAWASSVVLRWQRATRGGFCGDSLATWTPLPPAPAAAAAAAAAAGLVMRSEWARFRSWRHTVWTDEDLAPVFPLFLPANGTEAGGKNRGPKRVASYEPDTIDLVKKIREIRKERKYF
ncbi:unnamed protein product [Phaeothamnion confervicola]